MLVSSNDTQHVARYADKKQVDTQFYVTFMYSLDITLYVCIGMKFCSLSSKIFENKIYLDYRIVQSLDIVSSFPFFLKF